MKFCPHCGDPYMPCPRCGTDNDADAKRCVSCGTMLSGGDSQILVIAKAISQMVLLFALIAVNLLPIQKVNVKDARHH